MIGLLLAAGYLGAVLGSLWLLRRKTALHPELLRKGFHIAAGLLSAALPWLFTETWPVLVLGSSAAALLLAMRVVGALREGPGQVLGGVARASLGEFYFVLSVTILYLLAHDQPVLYTIPVLTLTFADALAALVGVEYGRLKYTTSEGTKSTEGSLAFFIVAFFSVHVPLLLYTDTGRVESLLIALLTGLLMVLFEGVAWRGLDNLFIPLGTYLALHAFLPMSSVDLGLRFGLGLALLLFAFIWRKATNLSGSALMGAVLVGFLSWAVGGFYWFLPPFLVFLAYPYFLPRGVRRHLMTSQVDAVLGVSAAGLGWLFLGSAADLPALYFPYAVSFATQLALLAGGAGAGAPLGVRLERTLRPTIIVWALLILPLLPLYHTSHNYILLGGALVCMLIARLTATLGRLVDGHAADMRAWVVRALVSLLASMLSLVPAAWAGLLG
jgi:phytol kinase